MAAQFTQTLAGRPFHSRLRRSGVVGLAVVSIATVFGLAPALAERRIALVIGNSAYTSIAKLPNPKRDADLVAASLSTAGFSTITAVDVNRRGFLDAVKSFVAQIDSETVAVVYYAGHGIQYREQNFLLPVDIRVEKPSDLPLEAISLTLISDEVNAAKPMAAIYILDACRDNPLKAIDAKDRGDLDDGLAKTPGTVGTFIAFATAPGEAALDGRGRNSAFSKALADYIQQPGLPVEQVFKRVRETVVEETGGRQVPWDNTSLITDFFFVKAVGEPPEVVRVSEADARAWQTASADGTESAYRSYLATYPSGLFADLAEAKTRKAEPEPAPPTQLAEKGRGGLAAASDLSDWNAANEAGTAPAFRDYLAAHPKGLFAKLARLRIEDTSAADLAGIKPLTAVQTPNFLEFAEYALYPEVTECDRLAGHVQEAADPAVGVFFKEIDPKTAVPACESALEQYPDSLRILINYGRAIDAAGRHEEARELYRAGAEAGFPIAYRSLGDVYRDGRGIEKNLKEARYWYALGAEKHNVFAELNLALIYEGGLGVPVDKGKAVQWLWRSAVQGFAPSMDKLADYYLAGEVVPKDPHQAALLLQGAAAMGHVWAEQKLGQLYLDGQGVEADPISGRLWLERSARQGNAEAQFKVATLYQDGVGGGRDPVIALKWLYVAQKGGKSDLDKPIGALQAKLSKKQVRAAKADAAAFTPRRVK